MLWTWGPCHAWVPVGATNAAPSGEQTEKMELHHFVDVFLHQPLAPQKSAQWISSRPIVQGRCIHEEIYGSVPKRPKPPSDRERERERGFRFNGKIMWDAVTYISHWNCLNIGCNIWQLVLQIPFENACKRFQAPLPNSKHSLNVFRSASPWCPVVN